MSDELKKIYQSAGMADRYFDNATPCDLWRAQSAQDFKKSVFLMEPHPGYEKKLPDGTVRTRLADVKIEQRDGQQFVLGCRCTSPGDYRGLSTFDKKVTWLGSNWLNYRIPKDTALPENLAISPKIIRSASIQPHITQSRQKMT